MARSRERAVELGELPHVAGTWPPGSLDMENGVMKAMAGLE